MSEGLRSGLFILLELSGDSATQVAALQREFDPRLANLGPPHVTIAGSSGMGPIAADTPVQELRERLEPIARETPPLVLPFQRLHRFMQTNIVVLPLDPHGPIRALHERIKTSGLRAGRPRFSFTPHCTVSLYPELPPERMRRLLASRITAPAEMRTLTVFHTTEGHVQSRKLLQLPLQG